MNNLEEIKMCGVQLMFTRTGTMEPYTNYVCKYCGKPFLKKHNKEMYCSEDCRIKAHQDQDAAYRRRRRKLINKGEIVSNENKYVGTGYLSHRKKDKEEEELEAIRKEMKRLKLI